MTNMKFDFADLIALIVILTIASALGGWTTVALTGFGIAVGHLIVRSFFKGLVS